MTWQSNAQGKRASLIELIPPKWRIPTSDIPSATRLRDFGEYICRFLDRRELEITNAPSSRILANIRSGEWTSVDVTRAFCHRASLAHQLTNCLSEVCFMDAEQRAKALDESFLRTGQTAGPLHGLPVSLKDRFNIEGLESACGYVSWLGEKKGENSEGVLVKRLRRMGAVFFVKTNVPMSMLMGETNNNIIGSTINPYNRNLSAGGASGGEGALLALKGSPLGWGSDIGLPVNGSVIGPMAGDLPTIEMAMKAVLDTFPWQDDCDVVEIPWREEKLQSIRSRMARPHERDGKLVFAVMSCDGNVQVHPPVQRAMSLVTKALLQRGYEVIEWQPPPHHDAVQILFQILGSTAGKEVRNAIDASGEPPVHQLQTWYDNDNVEPSSSAEFWDLCNQRDQYRSEYNNYWTSTREKTVAKRQVDGVIMPVAPTAAVEEGCFNYYTYSGIVNLLDYTSGSFPVTFADRSVDVEKPDHVPLNSTDRAVWHTYQKDLFDGAPGGLQVMGKRFEEEKIIGLMEALSSALQDFQIGQTGESTSPF
ncbi:MAG: Acetamidase [Alectoria fallacina]|uniref:Acetamidase n=1 Tax=Alectoria fallacina TaxID=1903189 RepID=A0A8H3IKB7_9LECA|nr:MAG: Acetamidase [Alectoria fallacina]